MVLNKRINDLETIETEHLATGSDGPIVKISIESDHTVLIGEVSPKKAREIANHIMESAARAEYEADLLAIGNKEDLHEEMVGIVFGMIRNGRKKTHTHIEE